MVEDRLRRHFDYYLSQTEVFIHSVLAVAGCHGSSNNRDCGPNPMDRP
jgi:hypothetical protein